MEATFSNVNPKKSLPTVGAKLMMHRIVSNSERMESFVMRENMLSDDHRCGACHNVSDAKVRMIKIIVNQDVYLCVYISYLFTDCVGALYLQPWGLAVGVINAFSSNAPGPIMRLLRGSQRSVGLIS